MGSIKKFFKLVFLFSTIGFIFCLFWKPSLPSVDNIYPSLLTSDPDQQGLKDNKPYILKIKEKTYKITPLANYDIQGLVVSEYDSQNWLDITHKNDPAQTKDLCLIWGSNLKNGVYRDLKYYHEEFTCYVYWDANQQSKFNGSQFSNNHLIPTNDKLTALIKNSHVGDQVQIKGMLINYEILDAGGKTIESRNTSTIRSDKGCEIILVGDFKILQTPIISYTNFKRGLLYTLLTSGLINSMLFFLPF
jgi:hypothetical protein